MRSLATIQRDRHLRNASDMRKQGMHEIRPYLMPPTVDTLELVKLRRVYRDLQKTLASKAKKREVLEINEVEKVFVGYRMMRVSASTPHKDHGTVQVHVYDGAERSPRHEAALLKMHEEGIQVLKWNGFTSRGSSRIRRSGS